MPVAGIYSGGIVAWRIYAGTMLLAGAYHADTIEEPLLRGNIGNRTKYCS